MSRSESKKWINVVGRLLLAYALIFTQSALAGQNSKVNGKAESPQTGEARPIAEKQSSAAPTAKKQTEEVQGEGSETAVAGEKSSRDGSHQGIKVHGHWMIEVRNPDGTVVTHREFENSLSPDGALMLAGLLSRTVSAGFWEIILGDVGGTQPCVAQGSPSQCIIIEPGLGNNIVGAFPTLTTPPGLGSPASVVLSGTATAGANSSINLVQTYFFVCSNATAPNAPCNISTPARIPGQNTFGFTSASLAPVAVSTGQTIAVTVIISFS
jgi:hypothetical protein